MTTNQMMFFGMLFIDPNDSGSVNVSTYDRLKQIQIYLNNALTLNASIQSNGGAFSLLTNDVKAIREFLPETLNLSVIEIPFTKTWPKGIPFRSAHNKIEVFQYLSELHYSRLTLLDLDMFYTKDIPSAFENHHLNTTIVYDITPQVVPVYGKDRIERDLHTISGISGDTKWYGGEFISGPPSFFKSLYETVETLIPAYIEAIPGLHHVGDEALTSSALRILIPEHSIQDGGPVGIVLRYWNCPVKHVQVSISRTIIPLFMHTPADKDFLARQKWHQAIESKALLTTYISECMSASNLIKIRTKSLAQKIKNFCTA